MTTTELPSVTDLVSHDEPLVEYDPEAIAREVAAWVEARRGQG